MLGTKPTSKLSNGLMRPSELGAGNEQLQTEIKLLDANMQQGMKVMSGMASESLAVIDTRLFCA